VGPKYNLVPGMPFIKYLSQDFDALHNSCFENVGKFLSNVFPEKKKRTDKQLLEIVEMTEFADVKTKYLSGDNSSV
jgi:hypothetical protein